MKLFKECSYSKEIREFFCHTDIQSLLSFNGNFIICVSFELKVAVPFDTTDVLLSTVKSPNSNSCFHCSWYIVMLHKTFALFLPAVFITTTTKLQSSFKNFLVNKPPVFKDKGKTRAFQSYGSWNLVSLDLFHTLRNNDLQANKELSLKWKLLEGMVQSMELMEEYLSGLKLTFANITFKPQVNVAYPLRNVA